jgi:hypothetical protein
MQDRFLSVAFAALVVMLTWWGSTNQAFAQSLQQGFGVQVLASTGNPLTSTNTGTSSALASITASSGCLPFGSPCTGSNIADATAFAGPSGIQLHVDGTHGSPAVFNTAEAIAYGLYLDTIVVYQTVYSAVGNPVLVPYAPSGGYLLTAFVPLGISIPPDGSTNVQLGVTIDQAGVPTFSGFLVYDPTTGFQINTGTFFQSHGIVDWIMQFPVVPGPLVFGWGETATLHMVLDTGTGTDPTSSFSNFVDPVQFEIQDPNGNIVPNLVFQSALGIQYSVVDGFVPTSGVPEPSTWAMMLIGFVGLYFAKRRTSQGCASTTT